MKYILIAVLLFSSCSVFQKKEEPKKTATTKRPLSKLKRLSSSQKQSRRVVRKIIELVRNFNKRRSLRNNREKSLTYNLTLYTPSTDSETTVVFEIKPKGRTKYSYTCTISRQSDYETETVTFDSTDATEVVKQVKVSLESVR